MIFIVSTCGNISKKELVELQKRLESEANSSNKKKVMCLPRFATVACVDDHISEKAKVIVDADPMKGNE